MTTWGEFLNFLADRTEYPQFIWRGQRDETWLLEPTLDRILKKIGKIGDSEFEEKHRRNFLYASRGRRGPNPPSLPIENDWWALGQHHGLATPLLDWTSSPYVAAFFTYASPKVSSTGYRMVFGISKTTMEWKSQKIADAYSGEGRPPVMEFVEPLADDNPRLVNQGGLFTRTPAGVDVEKWIRKNFPKNEKYIRLWKISLPERERENALRSLNRMNINFLSLFPDLYGASQHVNLGLEIKKY